MKDKKHIRWLYEQLPGLVRDGVVDDAAGERIQTHFGDVGEAGGRSAAVIFIGILGSVLVGAGIILLLAYNWRSFPQSLRTVMALLPMLVGHGLAAWIVWTATDSLAWREGVGAFLTLAVGAAIALISQTYHMPGSFDSFVLIWMILTLPVIYLLRAVLPALIYAAGIVAWASYEQWQAGQTLAYWPLLLALMPFVVWLIRRDPYAGQAVFLSWGLALSLLVGLGIVLEKSLPGLWIPLYLSLLTVFYLVGGRWFADFDSYWQRPLRVIGAAGLVLLVVILTWEWPWDDIGWWYYRRPSGIYSMAAVVDYVVGAGLVIWAVILLVTSVRRKQAWDMIMGSAPIVGLVGYALCSAGKSEIPAVLLFNLYALVLGVGLVVGGLRNARLTPFNGGMVLIAVLVVARFFDTEFGLLARGVAFILLGVGFLVCNLIIVRRKGASA